MGQVRLVGIDQNKGREEDFFEVGAGTKHWAIRGVTKMGHVVGATAPPKRETVKKGGLNVFLLPQDPTTEKRGRK